MCKFENFTPPQPLILTKSADHCSKHKKDKVYLLTKNVSLYLIMFYFNNEHNYNRDLAIAVSFVYIFIFWANDVAISDTKRLLNCIFLK